MASEDPQNVTPKIIMDGDEEWHNINVGTLGDDDGYKQDVEEAEPEPQSRNDAAQVSPSISCNGQMPYDECRV